MIGLSNAVARRVQQVATRATPGPVLVRCAVFLIALAGLVVAFPGELLTGRRVLVLPLLAAWPALAPRGRGATIVALITAAGWMLATAGYGEPVRLLPLLTLATLLYAGHSLTALAAVLPYDVIVSLEALARWLSQTILVVVMAAAVAVFALMVAGLGEGRTIFAASLVGIAIAVALSGLLAWLLRRR